MHTLSHLTPLFHVRPGARGDVPTRWVGWFAHGGEVRATDGAREYAPDKAELDDLEHGLRIAFDLPPFCSPWADVQGVVVHDQRTGTCYLFETDSARLWLRCKNGTAK